MADQDFQIRVVTTADTSGIKQTSAELDALRTKAAIPADVLLARQVSLQAALLPVPEALGGAAVSAEEIAVNGEKVTAALNAAGGASFLVGANLTRARQEALVLARELATGGNVTRTLGSLLGSLGVPITLAAVGGIALYEA